MVRGISYALVVALVLSACDGGEVSSYDEKELHERAQKLPLEERYEFYLRVYGSRTPRNPVLAEDVAALGVPARELILAKTRQADIKEFGAQLSVISAFGDRCSESEMQLLNRKATKLTNEGPTREALLTRVAVDCRWRSVVRASESPINAATAR